MHDAPASESLNDVAHVASGPAEARTAPPRRPLRVGIVADSPRQPRWIAAALSKACACGIAEIVVLAIGNARPEQLPHAWRIYRFFEDRLTGAGGLSRLTQLERRFAAPVIPLPADTRPAGIDAWRSTVAAFDLDVAFLLGAIDSGLVAGLARFGSWRYAFGTPAHSRPELVGVLEAARKDPIVASGLVARSPEWGERHACRSWARTHPCSVGRTRANALSKCEDFPVRAWRTVQERGADWLREAPEVRAEPTANLNRSLSLPALGSIGARVAHRGFQKALCLEQWFLAFRFGVHAGWASDLEEYHRVMPPTDRLWADPFPLARNGRHYIFFEEVPFASGRGRIVVTEVRRDGSWTEPVPVLERAYHLSYPFLIEWHGELFMIPETLQNRTVEIYRCIEFPGRWRLERVILRDARYADATVHREADGWWMFVNIGHEGAEAYDELHLFHANDLFADWRPHPRNPIKSDARAARPAGRLFCAESGLYRRAQICAPLYGSGVSINRVIELTPRDYAEREVTRIVPAGNSGIVGLHTVNACGDLQVIDAFVRRSRFAAAAAQKKSKSPMTKYRSAMSRPPG